MGRTGGCGRQDRAYQTGESRVGKPVHLGPGFGLVGPIENYALLPTAGKWLLIWCMLLGRLEIYTMIILLIPEFWRN